MPRRSNYHVVPNGKEWLIQKENETAVKGFSDKQEAVQEARRLAQDAQGSLYVHGMDGQIQTEWTYGRDPFPPEG